VQFNQADHHNGDCQCSVRIRKGILYRGSTKMLGQNFTVEFPTPKQGIKSLYHNMSQKVLKVRHPTFAQIQFFRFLSVWTLTNPPRIQAQLKMKRLFTDALFMPVEPFAGALKVCGLPWSEVSLGALIKAEDIRSVCSELWLVEQ
jgi:hypothetical protein